MIQRVSPQGVDPSLRISTADRLLPISYLCTPISDVIQRSAAESRSGSGSTSVGCAKRDGTTAAPSTGQVAGSKAPMCCLRSDGTTAGLRELRRSLRGDSSRVDQCRSCAPCGQPQEASSEPPQRGTSRSSSAACAAATTGSRPTHRAGPSLSTTTPTCWSPPPPGSPGSAAHRAATCSNPTNSGSSCPTPSSSTSRPSEAAGRRAARIDVGPEGYR